MEYWVLGPIAVVFSIVGAIATGSYQFGKTNFVKEHSSEPYCIEKTFGAETIKRCYIAKETHVKEH